LPVHNSITGVARQQQTRNSRLKEARLLETQSAPAASLQSAEVFYVDSRAALDEAYRRGLSRQAEIRSSSPTLLLDPDLKAIPADGQFSTETLQRFHQDVTDWAKNIYLQLRDDKDMAECALVIARRITRFQTKIFRTMALREEDFTRPIAAVTIEAPSATDREKLNPPFIRVLSCNPSFYELRLPPSAVPIAAPITPPPPNLISRLRFSDWQVKAYRLATTLWDRLPLRSPRGAVLILSESDLVKETAFHFAMRGFEIRHLTPPRIETSSDIPMTLLREKLEPLVRPRLTDWLAPSAVAGTEDYLFEEVEADVAQFRTSLPAWRKQLDDLAPNKPKVILSGWNAGPQATALAIAAGERGIPQAATQHGVTREISLTGIREEVSYETVTADFLLAYNRESARVTNLSPLVQGRAIPVGMQRDHYRTSGIGHADTGWPPIWYVSTMLHIGNFQGVNREMTDVEQAKREIGLIDDVLSLLPHKVLYKPYPASRYPDPDPVNLRAAAADNILLYEEAQDLRYLLPKARILVTSRPTSTLGWCMTSGRPIIYIEIPGQQLTPEAREAMTAGLFLFSEDPPHDNKPLREFLSQPIEDIERQWAARAAARQAMIEQFFDSGKRDAGAKAARFLIETQSQQKLSRHT
jgi:hypothetical protein